MIRPPRPSGLGWPPGTRHASRIPGVEAWWLRTIALVAVAPVALLARPGLAQDALGGRDSLQARFEVGAGTDVTNEQFYEDAFLDSVALGRRLVSDPETRFSGIVRSSLEGTRGGGVTGYRAQGEIAAGNKIQRGRASLDWRRTVSERWLWSFAPRVEVRKDQTFDRDL